MLTRLDGHLGPDNFSEFYDASSLSRIMIPYVSLDSADSAIGHHKNEFSVWVIGRGLCYWLNHFRLLRSFGGTVLVASEKIFEDCSALSGGGVCVVRCCTLLVRF